MIVRNTQSYFLEKVSQINFFEKKIINKIISYAFPVSYVALLFSGLIKGWKFNFGMDLTILFFLMSVFSLFFIETSVSTIFDKIKKKDILSPTLSLICFLMWYAFTAIWTLSQVYYIEKIGLVFFLLSIFIFPLLCKEDFVDRFLKTFTICGFFISAIYFFYYCRNILTVVDPFFASLKTAYLSYGRLIAGISFLLISSGRIYFGNSLRILLISFSILMLCISGARGPILFFTLTILVWLSIQANKKLFNFFNHRKVCGGITKTLSSYDKTFSHPIKTQKIFSWKIIRQLSNKKNILVFSFAILFLLFFYYLSSETLNSIFSRSFSRLGLLLNFSEITSLDSNALMDSNNINSGLGDSANIRLIQYYNAIKYILSNPINFFIGWGIGSYGLLENGMDSRHYPHNFILEIFVESGFIGISLFFIMILTFFKYFLRKNIIKNDLYLVLLLFYFFLCFLTSSSIAEARIPFSLLGVLLLLGRNDRTLNG